MVRGGYGGDVAGSQGDADQGDAKRADAKLADAARGDATQSQGGGQHGYATRRLT